MKGSGLVWACFAAAGLSAYGANGQVIQMQKRTISPTGRTPQTAQPETRTSEPAEPNRKLSYLEKLAQSPLRDRYRSGLKIHPSAWSVGAYPLSYEYRAGKKWSWEVGLQATNRNFWRESIWPAHPGISSLSAEYTWKLGGLVQGKYFFQKPAFQNGWYLGGQAQFRPYADKVQFTETNTGGGTTLQTIRPFRNHLDAGLLLGYQVRAAERWVMDFSLGAGVRRTYRAEGQEQFNAFNETVAVLNTPEWSALPYLQTGVKIGLLLPKKR